MKSSSNLILAAVLATALLAACKKPEPPTPAPEPKADAGNADSGAGTTTNYENPPAAAEPAKPSGQ
jgi:hypothetical protein